MIAPVCAASDSAAEILALFAQARRRRRRRRIAGIAVSLVLAGSAVLGLTIGGRQHDPSPRAGAGDPAASGIARSPLVAWVDDNWRLHLGDLATGVQRVVTQADAYPATPPLVQAGGRIYWVNQGGGYVQGAFWPTVIEQLNLATGKSSDIGPGEWVFASADGRQVYISQTDTTLTEVPAGDVPAAEVPAGEAPAGDVPAGDVPAGEVPAGGSGGSTRLTLPAGWYLPGGFSLTVASGILVQSNDDQSITRPPVLAVWHVRTGQVTVIGKAAGPPAADAIGAYTPPGAGHSLLAWMPASCHYPVNCPLRITDTSTLSSRTLRSPLPYGFALGGAFSPDGRQLAVFVNTSPGTGGGMVELAIVSTSTGAFRLVPKARLSVGEDVAWARWLPGGRRLIAGAVDGDYVVNAANLSARQFSFLRSGHTVIGYSAVIVPAR